MVTYKEKEFSSPVDDGRPSLYEGCAHEVSPRGDGQTETESPDQVTLTLLQI